MGVNASWRGIIVDKYGAIERGGDLEICLCILGVGSGGTSLRDSTITE